MCYHAYSNPAGSEELCSNQPSSHSRSCPVVKVTGLLPGGILPQINLHIKYYIRDYLITGCYRRNQFFISPEEKKKVSDGREAIGGPAKVYL